MISQVWPKLQSAATERRATRDEARRAREKERREKEEEVRKLRETERHAIKEEARKARETERKAATNDARKGKGEREMAWVPVATKPRNPHHGEALAKVKSNLRELLSKHAEIGVIELGAKYSRKHGRIDMQRVGHKTFCSLLLSIPDVCQTHGNSWTKIYVSAAVHVPEGEGGREARDWAGNMAMKQQVRKAKDGGARPAEEEKAHKASEEEARKAKEEKEAQVTM